MGDFLAGVRSIFTAIGLIVRDRRVRRLAIAPFAINVVLVVAGLPIILWIVSRRSGALIGGAEWVSALRVAAEALLLVVAAFVGLIAMLVLARIVAAPVMARLSEAVEERVLGGPPEARRTGLRGGVVDAGRSVLFSLARFTLFVVLYPFVLLSGLLPGIGPFVAPILTLLYGAFVLSLDFSEPVFERRLPGIRPRIAHVLRHPMAYLGFGSLAVVMALIPFANLAVLPVCVAAATIVYLRTSV
jgi:CysZ protein